jgi:hypothetical protein
VVPPLAQGDQGTLRPRCQGGVPRARKRILKPVTRCNSIPRPLARGCDCDSALAYCDVNCPLAVHGDSERRRQRHQRVHVQLWSNAEAARLAGIHARWPRRRRGSTLCTMSARRRGSAAVGDNPPAPVLHSSAGAEPADARLPAAVVGAKHSAAAAAASSAPVHAGSAARSAGAADGAGRLGRMGRDLDRSSGAGADGDDGEWSTVSDGEGGGHAGDKAEREQYDAFLKEQSEQQAKEEVCRTLPLRATTTSA